MHYMRRIFFRNQLRLVLNEKRTKILIFMLSFFYSMFSQGPREINDHLISFVTSFVVESVNAEL